MHIPRWLKIGLGWLICLIAYSFVVYKLFSFDGWEAFQWRLGDGWISILESLLVVLGLALGNVLLEAKKWQVLVASFKKLRLLQALKSVLLGNAVGIYTPARIGEVGGRVLLLEKQFRTRALFRFFFGSLAQSLATLVLGGGSLLLYLFFINAIVFFSRYSIGLWLLMVCGVALLLFVFWEKLFSFLKEMVKKRFEGEVMVIGRKVKVLAFLLSMGRFIIYSLQLGVLVKVFCQVPFSGELVLLPPIYFFVITLVPSFFMADLGIRGAVSIFVFERMSQEQPIVVGAVLILWLINVALPALTGSVFLIFGGYKLRH